MTVFGLKLSGASLEKLPKGNLAVISLFTRVPFRPFAHIPLGNRDNIFRGVFKHQQTFVKSGAKWR